MDPYSPLSYIILTILIALYVFFSTCEAAFENANYYKIEDWANEGNKRAKLTALILDVFDLASITIIVAKCLLIVVTIVLGIELFNNIFPDFILASIVSIILFIVIIYFLGEALPETLVRKNSEKIALKVVLPFLTFRFILYPITFLLGYLVKLTKSILGENKEENLNEDDFQDIVDKKFQDGEIDEEESDLIIAAVDFTEIIVNDVLTKRENIVALDIEKCNAKYLLKFFKEQKYSRIPVYKGSIDNILGILHVRTFLMKYNKNNKVSIKECLLPCYNVGPKITLMEMFKGFKAKKTHIAIVKEKNKTIGMVTMKDVLEELVEDIDEKGTSDGE